MATAFFRTCNILEFASKRGRKGEEKEMKIFFFANFEISVRNFWNHNESEFEKWKFGARVIDGTIFLILFSPPPLPLPLRSSLSLATIWKIDEGNCVQLDESSPLKFCDHVKLVHTCTVLGKYSREPVALKAGNVCCVGGRDSDDVVREGAIVLPRVRWKEKVIFSDSHRDDPFAKCNEFGGCSSLDNFLGYLYSACPGPSMDTSHLVSVQQKKKEEKRILFNSRNLFK